MSSIILEGIKFDELTLQIEKIVRTCLDEALQTEHKKTNSCDEITETYLSRKEVSQLLQISLVSLNRWTKEGKIKAFKIGTRVRYRYSDVEKAMIQIKPLKSKDR